MFLDLRAEAQLVEMIADFAQIVAAADFVPNLTKNFTDLIFESCRTNNRDRGRLWLRKSFHRARRRNSDCVFGIAIGHLRIRSRPTSELGSV
jgi:hypothetical protein